MSSGLCVQPGRRVQLRARYIIIVCGMGAVACVQHGRLKAACTQLYAAIGRLWSLCMSTDSVGIP